MPSIRLELVTMGYLMRMRRNVRSTAKNICVIDVCMWKSPFTLFKPPLLPLSLSLYLFFLFPLKSIENVVVAVDGVDKAKKYTSNWQTFHALNNHHTPVHWNDQNIYFNTFVCLCVFWVWSEIIFYFDSVLHLVIHCSIFFVSINHSARHYTRSAKESTKKIVSIKAKV